MRLYLYLYVYIYIWMQMLRYSKYVISMLYKYISSLALADFTRELFNLAEFQKVPEIFTSCEFFPKLKKSISQGLGVFFSESVFLCIFLSCK